MSARDRQQTEERLRERRESERAAQTAVTLETRESGSTVRSITPEVVTRHGGTLPFDATSTQLQDGQTVTDDNGDMNLRLNTEIVVTFSQFRTLNQMRNDDGELFVVSPAYSGPATFDQLKWDRIPDADGRVTATGKEQTAMYSVQLQSKEQNEDTGL